MIVAMLEVKVLQAVDLIEKFQELVLMIHQKL